MTPPVEPGPDPDRHVTRAEAQRMVDDAISAERAALSDYLAELMSNLASRQSEIYVPIAQLFDRFRQVLEDLEARLRDVERVFVRH